MEIEDYVKYIEKLDKLLIFIFLLILFVVLELTSINAGVTAFNQKVDIKVGDCWNDKTVTQIIEYSYAETIVWRKGCNISNNSQEKNHEDEQVTVGEKQSVEVVPIGGAGQNPDINASLEQGSQKEEQNTLQSNYSATPSENNSQEKENQSVNPVGFVSDLASDNHIPDSNCIKIKGDGIHNIIVTGNEFYNKTFMIDFGDWVYDTLNKETPYNETSWNLYYENNEGDCNFGNYSDFRITMGYINHLGLSWFDGSSVSKIWFVYNLEDRGYSFKWRFLLLHELGHIFTKADHSSDGSIMEVFGGNEQYNDYELNVIMDNLQ